MKVTENLTDQSVVKQWIEEMIRLAKERFQEMECIEFPKGKLYRRKYYNFTFSRPVDMPLTLRFERERAGEKNFVHMAWLAPDAFFIRTLDSIRGPFLRDVFHLAPALWSDGTPDLLDVSQMVESCSLCVIIVHSFTGYSV